MDLTLLDFNQFDSLTNQYTDQQIGNQFNVGKSKVGRYRRKLGVKSYGEKHNIIVGVKGVSNTSNRKYSFNERFFQCIDSEVKAYAIGLMMTDGHIAKNLHRARLALTEADSYVLRQIAEAMEFAGEFLIDKPREGNIQKHNMVVFNLNSTTLVQDLLALGLTTSKNTNTFLPKISPELECHLIRGIIDGDGSILKTDQLLSLSGRKELLENIVDCFKRHGFTRTGNITSNRSIHRLRMGQYATPILDWVYECNPTIVLKRKLELYQLRKQFIKDWKSKY